MKHNDKEDITTVAKTDKHDIEPNKRSTRATHAFDAFRLHMTNIFSIDHVLWAAICLGLNAMFLSMQLGLESSTLPPAQALVFILGYCLPLVMLETIVMGAIFCVLLTMCDKAFNLETTPKTSSLTWDEQIVCEDIRRLHRLHRFGLT